MGSDVRHILYRRAVAVERHQSVFAGARYAVRRRQHEIRRDGDAAAKVIRAYDQNNVTRNCLLGDRCTPDDGVSGLGCEGEPGEGEERVRSPPA
jgi:hypothetical protein